MSDSPVKIDAPIPITYIQQLTRPYTTALTAVAATGFSSGHWIWCLVIGALIVVWIMVGITNLGKINTVAMTARCV